MAKNDLFNEELKVINIGLGSFKESIVEAGGGAVQIDWKPPAEMDEKIFHILSKNESSIQKQNKKCLDTILNGAPFLIDLDSAIDVIPGMKKNMILHAGPPIT